MIESCVRSALLAILVLLPTVAVAQTEKLSEIERLRLQLLVERQRRLQAEYDAAMVHLQVDMTAAIAAAYEAHNVDKTKFRINPESGEFIAAPTQ